MVFCNDPKANIKRMSQIFIPQAILQLQIPQDTLHMFQKATSILMILMILNIR